MDDKEKNRIKSLMSSKHYMSRRILEKLKKQDFEEIRGIATGEAAGISRGDRIKAFHIVARLGSQEDIEMLGKIIGRDGEDVDLRAAAAVNLAYSRPDIAEKELMKHLDVPDNLIRSKVIKSLGMIGGPDAYEALLRLENVQADFVQKQLIFARALLAYRHNLDADPLPFLEGAEREQRSGDKLLKLTVKKVGSKKVGAARERFEGSAYGIELSKSAGFEVSVGRARWMMFINQHTAKEGIVKSINSRKMVMGLLSRWMRETDTYDAQYVVLTKPTEDSQVQIMVIRSDGEMFYSGKATVGGKTMTFMISDIDRPGTAPTRVKGKLTLRGIQLEVSIPVSKRENKRSPSTIEAKDFYNRFSNSSK